MRILVTGRLGQLARSLQERAQGRIGVEMVCLGRPEMDLMDAQSVRTAVLRSGADVVISAAAYTAVDQAETDRQTAWAVNVVGAEAVAWAAQEIGAPIIHLSTDYVFSGDKHTPYVETDEPAPTCEYGRTKRAGELAVMASNTDHYIIRTAWAYSPFGGNFVKTMLRLAGKQDSIRVVADQRGNPTSALDLADAILHLCRYMHSAQPGIYHVAGEGRASWADLAREVMLASAEAGGRFADIIDIPTSGYPTPALRPANSCLSCQRFSDALGWRLPNWRGSVDEVVRRLVDMGEIPWSRPARSERQTMPASALD